MNLNSTRRWLLTLCAAVSLQLLVTGIGHSQGAPLEDLSAFPQTTLTITSGSAHHPFNIWVANTPARSEQGLMFVRELPADKGMVFVEEQPRVWTMWMKNTYIPLDMLFVAQDGRIVKIAHAIPHDESIISSDVAVSSVIELKAGTSEQLHIKVGDIAKWKPIPGTSAAAAG